jgi:hypothetical protein
MNTTTAQPEQSNSAQSQSSQTAQPTPPPSSPPAENIPQSEIPNPQSPPLSPPRAPLTPIQIIHGELAVELYSLATTGKSAMTAVNPDFPPGNYPAIFQQYADKLPAAIDNYLSKPAKDCRNERFPHYREPAPREFARTIHLDEISVADQELIYQWSQKYTYERTLERLLYPPPIGLGIKTGMTSLRRLRARHETAERVALSTTEAQQISAAENSADEFIAAAHRLIRVRALETAMKPDSKTGELRDLFTILDRIRARDQADRKLALAENGALDSKTEDPITQSLPTANSAPRKT